MDEPDVIDEPDTTTDGTDAPAPERQTSLPRLVRVPGGIPNLDARLDEAAGVNAGPIVLRVRPEFYYPTGRTTKYTYVPWTGVSWGVEGTAEQLRAFREDLDGFIRGWVTQQQTAATQQGS